MCKRAAERKPRLSKYVPELATLSQVTLKHQRCVKKPINVSDRYSSWDMYEGAAWEKSILIEICFDKYRTKETYIC